MRKPYNSTVGGSRLADSHAVGELANDGSFHARAVPHARAAGGQDIRANKRASHPVYPAQCRQDISRLDVLVVESRTGI